MDDVLKIIQVFAPAKINLSLHITGQRADGYHVLDSLVMFADVGDTLSVRLDNALSICVEGPEAAGVPADLDNLVLRVARLFNDSPGARFCLTKNLPVASGIGGGSADAAAAFRALTALLNRPGPDEAVRAALLALGADIPMCVGSLTARVRGIGEAITPLIDVPTLDAVLVNPRRAVPTPTVFKALERRDHSPMSETIPAFANSRQMAEWIAGQRNDLEPPAMSVEPVIARVKAALTARDNCMLARMSGSGATCFGLFPDRHSAQAAAAHLTQTHPDWWVTAARLGDQVSSLS